MKIKMSARGGSAYGGKKLVIVGGGFAGVTAALSLAKKIPQTELTVTLVSKRNYHLFTPSIYEAATSEEELVSAEQTKKSVVLPFSELFEKTAVNFLQKQVTRIDPNQKKVFWDNGEITYDYLVLTTGSESDFFGIKGAAEFALTLKSLPDALRIRNRIEYEVQAHQVDINKPVLRLVVAGGGYTGLELAAELKGLADLLALKYSYPRNKIEIEIIEANNKLVAGFDNRLSVDAYNRLVELGVKVRISARISEVDQHFVYLMSGDKVAYDCLVWTAGIKATAVDSRGQLKLDAKNRVPVNEFLQSQQFPEIFSLGDTALIVNKDGKPVPQTAQDATHEGKYLPYVIQSLLKNHKPKISYHPKKHGFIVVLGGKWGIMSYNGVYLKGFLAWVVDQLAHFRYFVFVCGMWKAVKYLVFQLEMFERNDD